jgi:hypothetical protein
MHDNFSLFYFGNWWTAQQRGVKPTTRTTRTDVIPRSSTAMATNHLKSCFIRGTCCRFAYFILFNFVERWMAILSLPSPESSQKEQSKSSQIHDHPVNIGR